MTGLQMEKEVKELLKRRVMDTVKYTPTFCGTCGTYSSKKHQGVWCAHCPGKMEEYPEMTWADCLVKCIGHGSGWQNSLFDKMCPGDWNSEEWKKRYKAWEEMKGRGSSGTILKWAKEVSG